MLLATNQLEHKGDRNREEKKGEGEKSRKLDGTKREKGNQKNSMVLNTVKAQQEEEMPSLKLKVYPDMPFYKKGWSKGMYCKKIKNKNVSHFPTHQPKLQRGGLRRSTSASGTGVPAAACNVE
jgi:hypothetical protein